MTCVLGVMVSGWMGVFSIVRGASSIARASAFDRHSDLIDLEANVLFWRGEEDAA